MENLQIELVKVVDNKVVTTSLQVAEMFGKEHKHVMRDVRELLNNGLDESSFGLISQKDSMNREQPVYQLDRKGFTLLAMGFTGTEALKFKVAYIDAFDAMEAELLTQPKFQIPTTFAQALQLAATQAEELDKQKLLLDSQQPKVELYDIIMSSDKFFSMNDAAKMINAMGRNKLFQALRDAKILMLDNSPYQNYIDQGYFKLVESVSTNKKVYISTLVSNRGIDFICKRLNVTKVK